MKLWKMCWYDIKNGCLKNIKLLLFPIVYEIVVLFAMMQKVVSYEKYGMEVEKHLGDILLYNFGGMPKYVLSAEKVFEFPVIWTVFLVLILFATLSYPMTNLQGFGNKVLVKGQNRINGGCQSVCGICFVMRYFWHNNCYYADILSDKRHTV